MNGVFSCNKLVVDFKGIYILPLDKGTRYQNKCFGAYIKEQGDLLTHVFNWKIRRVLHVVWGSSLGGIAIRCEFRHIRRKFQSRV